jgi:glycosyltransferase involved in cell wall biosynthesis
MGIQMGNPPSLVETTGKNPLLVLSVGRLIPLKGYQYLLKAVQTAKKKGHSISLTIIGTGYFEGYLKNLAQFLDIVDHVKFISSIPREELMRLYSEFDVYIQSSIIEVVGLAALEALSNGLAMIVTDTGGLKDMVVDGINGFKVEPRSKAQIAKYLCLLATNRGILKRMKTASYQIAKDWFSWDTVLTQYETTINACISTDTTPGS